ncbi:MAG: TIGR01777 family oxidoreductase [Chloroflexota bacterium]
MKVFITGGTGFVGRRLSSMLLELGHELMIVTRSARGKTAGAGIEFVEGDPVRPGAWQERVRDADWIINLAGAPVSQRWTASVKKELRESRVLTTQNLVDALPDGWGKTFFSTSAIGYYGFHKDEELYEDAAPGADFLGRLSVEWEGEAHKAKQKGARVVITRFGIVIGRGGGLLGSIVPVFKKFLGGPVGSGKQWMSWVHIDDLAEAFPFLLSRQHVSGPVNFTAPNPVRNGDFAKILGKVLNVPAVVPTPGFAMKLALGEFGSVVLEGQKVLPGVLAREGFPFRYPYLEGALRAALADEI